MSRKRNGEAGVTLIEMMVVVIIMGLFAYFVLPKFMGQADKAKKTAARAQISSYGTALSAYKLDVGTYPTTDQGLQALRTQPEGVANWQGPYVEQDIAPDPWGHPYVYRFPGDHGGDEPDLISYGADGQPGGDGNNADIVSWKAQ